MKSRYNINYILIAICIIIIVSSSACGQTALPDPTEMPIPNSMSTEPPTLPVDSTPSQTATGSATLWKTYRNEVHGFTFEYPAIYDEVPYKDSCGIQESNDGIHLGHQIELLFLNSGGLDLAEYTSNLLQSKGWNVDSQENKVISDLEATAVQYRFGGTNRFGTFTLVKDGETIFAFNFSAGSFCDIPESQASEPNAYSHILETFRLDK